jgi:hypothetical protein
METIRLGEHDSFMGAIGDLCRGDTDLAAVGL